MVRRFWILLLALVAGGCTGVGGGYAGSSYGTEAYAGTGYAPAYVAPGYYAPSAPTYGPAYVYGAGGPPVEYYRERPWAGPRAYYPYAERGERWRGGDRDGDGGRGRVFGQQRAQERVIQQQQQYNQNVAAAQQRYNQQVTANPRAEPLFRQQLQQQAGAARQQLTTTTRRARERLYGQ